MKTFRSLLWLLVGLTLAVFALPASAAKDKLYSLSMCIGTFDSSGVCQETQIPQGIKTIQARVSNESPPKATNSQISSFDLQITNGLPWQFSNAQVLPPNSGNVDATTSPGHIRVTNLSPVKPQDFVILQFTIDSFSCGEGVWDVTPYTGSGLTGNIFTRDAGTPPHTAVVCGDVNCGNSLVVQASAGTPSSDPRYVLLTRSSFNQDGTSACTAIGVVVTPMISPKVTVTTDWDPDALALFQYTVNLYSNSATTPPVVQVAWKLKTDGTLDFQNALNCEAASPGLPIAYATLAADNGGKIQVNPPVATLPAVPFPIKIDTDRMVVTKVNSQTNTWTVTRSAGSPTHAQLANVVSTPLPVIKSTDGYPQSYVGTAAKMCKNAGPTYTGAPANADGLYPWSTTIIDGADAVVKGSF